MDHTISVQLGFNRSECVAITGTFGWTHNDFVKVTDAHIKISHTVGALLWFLILSKLVIPWTPRLYPGYILRQTLLMEIFVVIQVVQTLV